MNNDSNYDKLVRAIKKAQVEEIDVAPNVMQRIRGYEQARKKPIRSSFRLRASVVIMALFLLTAVSVSGAATLLFEWNGMEIKTFKYEPKPGKTWHDHMTFLQLIDHELQKSPEVWKEITLEEAQKESPVPLMRPVHTDKKPVRTFGVVMIPGKQWEKDDVHVNGFYDVFGQGKEQIVVRQNASKREPVEGRIEYFYPEQWEVVKVNEQIMSVYWEYNNTATLDLQIKFDESTMIHLSLDGKVSKKELVKLAEAYIGQKLKL
ncbi:hypothetical protein ACFFNY_20435 [Paenibacillus hodogayensis]|uniref:DUF4367 domain-containing protein n=1 Tax=Paenibacillus hodogayensis TaxID=279208 RepID=A0ABV5W050_9BACL